MRLADLHEPDFLADCERSDSGHLLVILSEAAPLGAKPRGLCDRLQAASHYMVTLYGDRQTIKNSTCLPAPGL